MRLRLLFCILITAGSVINHCNAQEAFAKNNPKIDSLNQLIDHHTEDDEEKVRLLNEYARVCFYNKDFKNGLIATSEARLLSDKLNFPGGKIMYFITMSLYNGSGQMSTYYLRLAEQLSKDQQLEKYYVSLQELNFEDDADWEKLEEKYTDILMQLNKLGDKETQANVLFDLSYFSY